MLTDKDLSQLSNKQITEEKVIEQINHFKTGFPFSNIQYPAIKDDGILSISIIEQPLYIQKFNEVVESGLSIQKFVPASGAATRMFKSLFEFIQAHDAKQKELSKQEPYTTFLNNLADFAFYEDLKSILSADDLKDLKVVISTLLNADGLNYGELPKGLLKFHKYTNGASTPLEEHIREGANYAVDINDNCAIHFTVSTEHQSRFEELVNVIKPKYEALYPIKLDITFSSQKPSTDTLAVSPDNNPFREDDGALLFRPGGHGALIENLNDLEAQLIFIKNIDNVVPEYRLSDTVNYKKILAGVLLRMRDDIFEILNGLDGANTSEKTNWVTTATEFIKTHLKQELPEHLSNGSTEEKASYLHDLLNRPIRACGMVKNEGEAGGGPFWVKQSSGQVTLQIVEGAQIDPSSEERQNILKQSTHFNPVDLVCYTYDYKNEKFDLKKYVDEETGFISEKSKNGRDLKALELPGLWNGAMANWLTFFVEVPISTFNPVKTVMDLLRPQHQPE